MKENCCDGGLARDFVNYTLFVVLVASVLAAAKPSWQSLDQGRLDQLALTTASIKKGKIDRRVLPYQLQTMIATQRVTAWLRYHVTLP